MNRSFTQPARPWFRSASGWAWIGFAAIAAFYLLTEHRAHLLGVLPFAIFLLCPLLHMLHHGGHAGHGGAEKDEMGGVTTPHRDDGGGSDQ